MVILIAEDEASIRRALELLLKSEHEVICCEDGRKALDELSRSNIDLVITDYQMPFLSGIELIKRGKEVSPSTAFILMTAFGSTNQAVEAIQLGADDYFSKPFDVSEMKHRIRKIEELRTYKTEKLSQHSDISTKLIGQSPFAKQASKFLTAAASSTSAVLLTGPHGSGKEFIAQAIHETSNRSIYPLITIDCLSLQQENGAVELFGLELSQPTHGLPTLNHASTVTASSTKPAPPKRGKIELARGGTLILREITSLPMALQKSLISVLREGFFVRVGGQRKIQSQTRVIATSSLPIKPLIESGNFSAELFYQLNILELRTPSLKERPEDISAFVEHFWNQLNRLAKDRIPLPAETQELLFSYEYPGNLRELKNVLERLAVLSSQTGAATADLLPAEFKKEGQRSSEVSLQGLDEELMAVERKLILNALQMTNYDETKAAKALKISPQDLQLRLKRLGISETKKVA